jgi:tryptophan synthase alpha chain
VLEDYLKNRLKKKDILLMTHIVLGYPSFDACYQMISSMVEADVDLMELQIPFSEPIADGPVILRANQEALRSGTGVRDCLDFADRITRDFNIPFLIMSYYNILFKYGLDPFLSFMKKAGLKGAIIPDLPPEEGRDYFRSMKNHKLDPILIFSPTTPDERMAYLNTKGRGFFYCVARKGVTGDRTYFSEELADYLARCRRATGLPLALGFGVKEKADIDYLKGKADIAVIGTQTIRLVEEKGIEAVGDFLRNLV